MKFASLVAVAVVVVVGFPLAAAESVSYLVIFVKLVASVGHKWPWFCAREQRLLWLGRLMRE